MKDLYNILKFFLPELFDEEKAFKSSLPKITRFQILTILAVTWAFIFAQMTMNFLNYGITLTTSVIAHILIIAGIIFTRRSLGIDYKFKTYHSTGRARGHMRGIDGSIVKFDKNDPGGEHE